MVKLQRPMIYNHFFLLLKHSTSLLSLGSTNIYIRLWKIIRNAMRLLNEKKTHQVSFCIKINNYVYVVICVYSVKSKEVQLMMCVHKAAKSI